MVMSASTKVNLRDCVDTESLVHVNEHGDLDPVSTRNAELLKHVSTDRPFAGKRLDDGCEFGPPQGEDRPGHELGDATTLSHPLLNLAAHQVAVVVRLRKHDVFVGKQWLNEFRDVLGGERGDVSVDENDDVAL